MTALVIVVAAVASVAACTTSPDESLLADRPGGGGAVVGTIRNEPQTFNRLAASDNVSVLMTRLMQASLVRINRTEDVVEPWLAERWSSDDDGRTHTLTLRDGLTFSDGAPFTSADVLFSFEAVYDERVGSALADSLLIDGRPIGVEAPDATTVVVRFPVPYSPGLRLLDSLPMLPRHLLEPALREGTFQEAWGLATPPAEMAGLGPFVLESYQPGQRLVFARNTRYWRTDAAGVPLPYLDRITLEIVADQNAEMLRLETGEVDFISSGIRAEDFGSLSRAAEAGQMQLFHLGVGLDADFLAFNLQPAAMAGDPRQPWLQSLDWRIAVSHAVDRTAFANTIYLGLAEPVFGPITPGNRTWFLPDLPVYDYDLQRAQELLDGLGLGDRDGDGLREDRGGRPVRFTLLTQQGNTSRERAAQVLQADLRQVGIGVDVVPLAFGALIERVMSMDFDAAYLGFRASDTDPTANLDFWLSSAAFHLWNPSQPTPATAWERRIDELFGQQVAISDMDERVRLFAEVQTLFAEHQPVLYFAAPRLSVATSTRLANVEPSLLAPYVLWNADTLAVRGAQTPSP
ncbi:MAG: ABC transporter substrate-binding protein [Acidobacteria bacterium]|nr:ABC transporter substrate-binding protein [Acidobacteriota bacterium]